MCRRFALYFPTKAPSSNDRWTQVCLRRASGRAAVDANVVVVIALLLLRRNERSVPCTTRSQLVRASASTDGLDQHGIRTGWRRACRHRGTGHEHPSRLCSHEFLPTRVMEWIDRDLSTVAMWEAPVSRNAPVMGRRPAIHPWPAAEHLEVSSGTADQSTECAENPAQAESPRANAASSPALCRPSRPLPRRPRLRRTGTLAGASRQGTRNAPLPPDSRHLPRRCRAGVCGRAT